MTMRAGIASDRVVDAGIAVVVALVQVLGTQFAGPHPPTAPPLDHFASVLLLVGPAVLVFRRRYPVAVLYIGLASQVAYAALGYPSGPIYLALIVAFFTTMIAGHRA